MQPKQLTKQVHELILTRARVARATTEWTYHRTSGGEQARPRPVCERMTP